MKIYLKVISLEFNLGVTNAKDQFIKFTKELWIQDITEQEIGTLFCQDLRDVLELENIYVKTKNQYDILYKELNIEKNTKLNIIIIVVLIISIILNIFNYKVLLGK